MFSGWQKLKKTINRTDETQIVKETEMAENVTNRYMSSVDRTLARMEKRKAIDRANVSSRTATFILAEIVRSLGHEIYSLNVNWESIRKARLKFRKQTAYSEKTSFDPSVFLLMH